MLPLTALATTVRYGPRQEVFADFADGRSEAFPVSALDDLVTERGNPGNRRRLRAVTVLTDAALLERGVELVDTPGSGSVHGHNTIEAESAPETMDAAVFVLTADPPVSGSERELIAKVAKLSVEMFVVLNKADHLDGTELAEVLAFTGQVVSDAAGRVVRVYPLSARAALARSGNAGFRDFAADFGEYLDRGGISDMRLSVQGHARRIVNSLRDEVTLARRAALMRDAEAIERVCAELDAVRQAAAGQWNLPAGSQPDDDAEYGRGLAIIAALADKLGHDVTPEGQTSWAEVHWAETGKAVTP